MTRHGNARLGLLAAGFGLALMLGCGRGKTASAPALNSVVDKRDVSFATKSKKAANDISSANSGGAVPDRISPRAARRDRRVALSGPAAPVSENTAGVPERPQDAMPLPLTALGVNPDLKLTADQVHLMASLGDEFVAATADPSGANRVDNNDKERAVELWQAAQSINDERFRALFGDEVFNAQQVYRAQVEQEQSGRPGGTGL
jgi:hypothetical protein